MKTISKLTKFVVKCAHLQFSNLDREECGVCSLLGKWAPNTRHRRWGAQPQLLKHATGGNNLIRAEKCLPIFFIFRAHFPSFPTKVMSKVADKQTNKHLALLNISWKVEEPKLEELHCLRER